VNRARREAPNEPVVYFVKALLHRLDGEYGRALRSYDRLVRLDPAAHVVASYSRALVYMYMGQFDETFRSSTPRAMLTTHSCDVSRARVVLHGQTDAAAELMKDVVDEHPNMHGIRPFMAMFLSAQGKHDEALAQLTPAVKRNGEVDADISYSIGSVYALEGLPEMLLNGSSVRSRSATRTSRASTTIRTGPILRTIRVLLS
jgi:serine/threonine-protein kinase